MNVEKNNRSGIAEIDYSRDTLFGPVPMQATCRVRLETVEQDGQLLRELTILGEVPDYLPRSTVIRVALEGKIEAGPIRDHRHMSGKNEKPFTILFENEHRGALH